METVRSGDPQMQSTFSHIKNGSIRDAIVNCVGDGEN